MFLLTRFPSEPNLFCFKINSLEQSLWKCRGKQARSQHLCADPVVHPSHGVGAVQPVEPLHLPFTRCGRPAASLTLSRPATAFSITFTRCNSF